MLYAIVFQTITLLMGGRAMPFEQISRYSTAIANVVETEQLPFSGREAKAKAAILIAVVAFYESGFREEIESCTSPRRKGWEDNGHSISLLQLYDGPARYGFSRDEICGDVELQFRLGLRYLTAQIRQCGDVERGLSSYNSNHCQISIYGARIENAASRVEIGRAHV